MKVLVINQGTSSTKCAMFDSPREPKIKEVWKAKLDWSSRKWQLVGDTANGAQNTLTNTSREQAVEQMLNTLWGGSSALISDASEVDMVGHRIVHGGSEFTKSVIVDEKVKAELERLQELAPDHNKLGLEGIALAERIFPNAKQVAVFDTSFHHDMPLSSVVYGLPYAWYQQGIRRYGFHGISHQYATERAAQLLKVSKESVRIVICHLGSGCSLTAVRNGQSIDTTMGFSPLEGTVMASRSGTVDPGILIYMLEQGKVDVYQLDDVLRHQSGLKGVSGLSGDMREIVSSMGEGNERAGLAFEVYIHSLVKHIGSMVAILGGLDVLVFTGGVGENSPKVRTAAAESLKFLGVEIDRRLNDRVTEDQDVSAASSKVRTLVIQAQEELEIARECAALVGYS